jgi:hypothetical protein
VCPVNYIKEYNVIEEILSQNMEEVSMKTPNELVTKW